PRALAGRGESYLCTPIAIAPTYPEPLFFTFRRERLPPLTKIMSLAFVVSGLPRAAYGAALYTDRVSASEKNSWPVCTTEPPTCTFTWMCTARPWYHPG